MAARVGGARRSHLSGGIYMLKQLAPPGAAIQSALLADASEVTRIGLTHLLQACQVEVVASCASGADALRLAQRHQPDLILLETHLADGPAFDTCRALAAACPRSRIIFLTVRDGGASRALGLGAGAAGVLPKETAANDLGLAILALARRDGPARPTLGGAPLLSPQERKIPPLVAAGRTNREIAELLGLSEKTVKNYLSNIFAKLDLQRRAQLAAMFARAGA